MFKLERRTAMAIDMHAGNSTRADDGGLWVSLSVPKPTDAKRVREVFETLSWPHRPSASGVFVKIPAPACQANGLAEPGSNPNGYLKRVVEENLLQPELPLTA
jgi:hypothetical protein